MYCCLCGSVWWFYCKLLLYINVILAILLGYVIADLWLGTTLLLANDCPKYLQSVWIKKRIQVLPTYRFFSNKSVITCNITVQVYITMRSVWKERECEKSSLFLAGSFWRISPSGRPIGPVWFERISLSADTIPHLLLRM